MNHGLNWQSGQVIALVCIVASTWLAFDVFLYSRNDHDMKMLALGCVISQIASVMATASTLLVGKVFGPEKQTAMDVPPGSVITSRGEQQVVQTPPIAGGAEAGPGEQA